MKELDANSVERDYTMNADICIVGSGAAGITIANSLLDSNVQVLLIESGGHFYEERTQNLYDFKNIGYPLRAQKGYISRNRYFGGSTNTWLGRSAPLNKEDFKRREWVENSGWPIKSEDLEKFYVETANMLKIPNPEFLYNDSWRKYIKDEPNLFLDDGKLCPTVFLLGKKPINMRTAYKKKLRKANNIEIVLQANVTEIITDENEKTVNNLIIKTLDGNKFTVKSKKYIFACGGWENPRILLASKRVNNKGVGNQNDNVGRYYAEHPKILGSKIIPFTNTLKSPVMFWKRKISRDGYVRLGIKLSESLQRKHQLNNDYVEFMYPKTMSDAIAQSERFFNNIGFSRSTIHNFVKLAPHVFNLAETFERMMFNLPLKFHDFTMITHMEQIPEKESRVTLDEERDELNMQKLKVNLKITKKSKESMKRFHNVLGVILEENGLGRLESDLPSLEEHWPKLTDSSHHIGTTRMSEDPKKGVVDKNCKVHGIDNLYIAGSSNFPTGGHVNPTFTIVALSLRLAAHLKAEYK